MTESTTGERYCANCGAVWGKVCCPDRVLRDPWIGIPRPGAPGGPLVPGYEYPDSGGNGIDGPFPVPTKQPFKCQGLDDAEIPIVSENRGDRNSSAIRAALAILSDLKHLGHLDYYAGSSSQSKRGSTLHKERIEVAYWVREDTADD